MMPLACILIAFAIVGTYADEPEKLVNGIPTSIDRHPYAISMQTNGQHMCGGSIISSQYVLTAAHCLVPINNPTAMSRVTIRTGTTYTNRGGSVHRIKRLIIHPNYVPTNGRAAGYDIGLIELAQPIQFNQNQQAVRLPTSNVVTSDAVTIATWGSTGYRQSVHTDLRQIVAQCMLPAECQQRYQTTMKIHQMEFCTLISQGTGTCNGDSGSGAIRRSDNTILGLVSGGIPCARGYPDVKTNVFYFVSWIRSIVSGI